VHLPGKTDAGNIAGGEVDAGESFLNRDAASAPPVFGILLSPSDLRRRKRSVLFGGGGQQMPLLIDDESARASGAYVDA
jgi:hypothetical protein